MLHGGSTHFPIVLLLASVAFDVIASRLRDTSLRRGLHAAGLGSAMMGVLGGCGAVVSGLVMSGGQMLGSGQEKMHHLFVWPAFGLAFQLVIGGSALRALGSRFRVPARCPSSRS